MFKSSAGMSKSLSKNMALTSSVMISCIPLMNANRLQKKHDSFFQRQKRNMTASHLALRNHSFILQEPGPMMKG